MAKEDEANEQHKSTIEALKAAAPASEKCTRYAVV